MRACVTTFEDLCLRGARIAAAILPAILIAAPAAAQDSGPTPSAHSVELTMDGQFVGVPTRAVPGDTFTITLPAQPELRLWSVGAEYSGKLKPFYADPPDIGDLYPSQRPAAINSLTEGELDLLATLTAVPTIRGVEADLVAAAAIWSSVQGLMRQLKHAPSDATVDAIEAAVAGLKDGRPGCVSAAPFFGVGADGACEFNADGFQHWVDTRCKSGVDCVYAEEARRYAEALVARVARVEEARTVLIDLSGTLAASKSNAATSRDPHKLQVKEGFGTLTLKVCHSDLVVEAKDGLWALSWSTSECVQQTVTVLNTLEPPVLSVGAAFPIYFAKPRTYFTQTTVFDPDPAVEDDGTEVEAFVLDDEGQPTFDEGSNVGLPVLMVAAGMRLRVAPRSPAWWISVIVPSIGLGISKGGEGQSGGMFGSLGAGLELGPVTVGVTVFLQFEGQNSVAQGWLAGKPPEIETSPLGGIALEVRLAPDFALALSKYAK